MDRLTLTHGNFIARLYPEMGGILTHFQSVSAGRIINWLRPAPEVITSALDAACYPLLPFFSRLSGNALELDGKSHPLPPASSSIPYALHGFGWTSRWDIAEISTARAVLNHRYSGDNWPRPYHASLTAELDDHGLVLGLSLTNDGDRAMPVGLGFHPFFERHADFAVRAHLDAIHIMGADGLPVAADPAHPAVDILRRGDYLPIGLNNIFEGWNGSATISTAHGPLRMTAPSPLDFLCIYAPENQPFTCVEPVSHTANAFNLGKVSWGQTGDRRLAPGATLTASSRFSPLV